MSPRRRYTARIGSACRGPRMRFRVEALMRKTRRCKIIQSYSLCQNMRERLREVSSGDVISPYFQTSSFSELFGTFPVADSESNSLLNVHCCSRKSNLGKYRKVPRTRMPEQKDETHMSYSFPTHTSISISLSLSLYIYIYIYVYIDKGVYVCMCVYIYIHVYIYIYTYSYRPRRWHHGCGGRLRRRRAEEQRHIIWYNMM